MLLKNLHKLRGLILSKKSAVLIALVFPVFYTTSAFATYNVQCNYSSPNSFCLMYSASSDRILTCEHAWQGPPAGCNNSNATLGFSFIDAGGGWTQIEEDLNSQCIGDFNNDSSNASAGGDACPTTGNAGWGTKWSYGTCSNGLGAGFFFVNAHWGSFLGPQTFTDGARYYLNKPNSFCFVSGYEI